MVGYSDSSKIIRVGINDVNFEIDEELGIMYVIFSNGRMGQVILSDVNEAIEMLRSEKPACPVCKSANLSLGLSSPPPIELSAGLLCPDCESSFKLIDGELVLFEK